MEGFHGVILRDMYAWMAADYARTDRVFSTNCLVSGRNRHMLGFPTSAKAVRGTSFDAETMFFYIQSFDPVTSRAIRQYPTVAGSYKLGIPGVGLLNESSE